jgi:hypothetical protein
MFCEGLHVAMEIILDYYETHVMPPLTPRAAEVE